MCALTVEFHDSWRVASAPAEVFPLLCPVREYDWIDGWKCEMVHSESGVAEEDCIFRTERPGQGRMIWVVSRYEPARAIEFTCFVPDALVMRLKIALEAADGGTVLHWSRRFLCLDEGRPEWRAATSGAATEATMKRLRVSLDHYLATGAMLR